MNNDRYLLALDAESVRRYDKNGNLHVTVSHLTKAQVRPYYGHEVPDWERLMLDPQKIYRGYCPPEELSKPETIESTNGIPIQLNHHPDYADAPQIKTRVGSTGTDGAFRAPYLDNSLHFTVEDAIKRIVDGSMRELSLSYRYTPDFIPGKTPDGEDYDFVMRDITANHVALVEQGRAGRDVLVQDSHLREAQPMDVTEKNAAPVAAADGDPAVEKKEVALADAIAAAANGIKDLHEQDEEGNVVDKPAEEAQAADEDKDAAIKRIIAEMVSKGMKPEDAEGFADALKGLAYTEAEDDEIELGEDDGEGDEKPAEDNDECAQLIQDGLKACGYDDEPEEFQKAFAEGVRYGERKEKTEPEKLDREHESEGEERALGQDAALKRVERRIARRFTAMDECAQTLGRVRFNAYDSAEGVYLAALKQEGVSIKGVRPEAARAAYLAFMAGKKVSAKRSLAQDAQLKTGRADSILSTKLSQIKKGY